LDIEDLDLKVKRPEEVPTLDWDILNEGEIIVLLVKRLDGDKNKNIKYTIVRISIIIKNYK